MLKNAERYQGLMGALLWISRVSHPEIIAAVTILCRYTKNPSMRHLRAAEQVLLYLKGAQWSGLKFSKSQETN